MKLNGQRFLLGALGLFTAASFTGLITGTLAWYASNSRATVAYEGTSVRESEQLQIGLVSDRDFLGLDPNNEDFKLTKETIGGEDYYWAKPGSGLSGATISAYLSLQNHATNTLEPVTSRVYNTGSVAIDGTITKGDALHLYHAPKAFTPLETGDAPTNAYCAMTFAFRVWRTNAMGEMEATADQSIWITDTAAHPTDPSYKIQKALRCYFDDGRDRFILNPGSTETTKGQTAVAGLLNLSSRDSDYYDYDPTLGSDHEEIIYGDYTGSATPVDNPTDSELDDVNGTGQTDPSTFLAKHAAGTKAYTSFAGLTLGQAEYETLRSNAPDDDGSGHLSKGRPVCITANDAAKIATVDMTVWLEGWDHTVINEELSSGFNLGLQFQINRM